MAAPGPWADDYTPPGGAGRFFGDYVNWARIEGYRHAALDGPLAALATQLVGGPARFFHEHAAGQGARHARGRRRGTTTSRTTASTAPQRQPVGAARSGAGQAGVRVPASARIAGDAASCPASSSMPRRTPQPTTASSWCPTSTRSSTSTTSSPSIVEPGDVIAFHFRTLHAAPGTAGLLDGRRRAVSFRYVGSDARFAARPWLHSPPFDPIDPGAPLDDERFPPVPASLPRRGPAIRADVLVRVGRAGPSRCRWYVQHQGSLDPIRRRGSRTVNRRSGHRQNVHGRLPAVTGSPVERRRRPQLPSPHRTGPPPPPGTVAPRAALRRRHRRHRSPGRGRRRRHHWGAERTAEPATAQRRSPPWSAARPERPGKPVMLIVGVVLR